MSLAANPRQYVVKFIFVGVAFVILIRLLFLQLFEDKYKVMANDIAILRKVVYPPRGVIYDRKGKVMCYNQKVYDLMVTPNEVPKDMDIVQFCNALGIDTATYKKLLDKSRFLNGPMRQGLFLPQLSEGQIARFQENAYSFRGFVPVARYIRSYPKASAASFLGYIGEVSPAMLKKDRFSSYQQGDYVGKDGLEFTYEEVLRGQRGVEYKEKDNFNRERDAYKKGALDTAAISGSALQLYIDAELQAYGEKLMQNKLGSIVAIDPATGGILAMVSSPGFDPNLLSGADRSKNYAALYNMATKPLFNRAMKASYPPGSTQKPLTALIGLDEGAITPSFGYPCGGSYRACGRPIACTHAGGGHAANLRLALAHSCNSYFCDVYRRSVDLSKFGGVKNGLQEWYQYMYHFGIGHPTGVDIPFEIGGTLFDSAAYNKMYHGSWNSCTNVFIGMGQGELTETPLQMANAMCLIANHGFYYKPHFVRAVGNNANDSVLNPYKIKQQFLHIPDTTYGIVALGMQDVVESGTATVAKIEGIDICAKTGTAENKAVIDGKPMKMQNHSMFVAFAPRIHPKIAIAVAVENAGYGATWAGPIASLMIEKYLRDSISSKRKAMEERMIKGNVISKYTYILDSAQRAKDRMREERKMQMQAYQDSVSQAQRWAQVQAIVERYYSRKKQNSR
ncbi:penicillin-binding protein 2 [Chitinophagaceae bacterium MMS25-I14]